MPKDRSALAYEDVFAELQPPKRKWLTRKVVAISKRLGFRVLRRLGLLDNSNLHRKHRPMYYGHFWGDQPTGVGSDVVFGSNDADCFAHDQFTRSFVVIHDFEVPPENFSISNVTYTSNGFTWIGRTLQSNASVALIRSPLRFFKEIPLRVSRRINQGTIVQAYTPFTYGDWVPEHRNSIISTEQFPRPLILPAWIGNRPYVQKELAGLGIEYIVIDENIFIQNAYVLSTKHRRNLVFDNDVQAYRTAYNVPDVLPTPGKIVYLSRVSFTRTVEIAGRNYPSEVIGKIIEELGGKVIITDGKDRDYYRKIAVEADIVIADHGGAMFNIMEWKPRVVIEIVEDGWWVPCFVFLSAACGAKYHGIIRSSHRSESDLRKKIIEHIENGITKTDQLTIHKIRLEETLSLDSQK